VAVDGAAADVAGTQEAVVADNAADSSEVGSLVQETPLVATVPAANQMDDSWTEAESKDINVLLDTLGLKHKSVRRDFIFAIRRQIERYGDDGYGDKPSDMSRVMYWGQHLDTAKFQKDEVECQALVAKAVVQKEKKAKKAKKATEAVA